MTDHIDWDDPATKRRARATFVRLIEKFNGGKHLDDLTEEEVLGAVAVMQAEAAVYAAEQKGTP